MLTRLALSNISIDQMLLSVSIYSSLVVIKVAFDIDLLSLKIKSY